MNQKTSDFHRQHFDSIQVLRGVAALLILLEHIRFLNCGAFAVDIFFCVSGFMIMFSTGRDTKHFLLKRLIRILPLYYLMTVGTFILLVFFPGMFQQSKADPVFLAKSLLFIPFDIGNGAVQPLMRIGWTINCEIFFYVLFFIALKITYRFRGLLCGVFLFLIVIAARFFPDSSVVLQFYGNPVMLEFVYGILIYYAAEKLYRFSQTSLLPKAGLYLSLSAAAACLLGLLITKPSINILGFRRPLVWGLPAAAMVLCAFAAGLYLKKMPGSLVELGNASFSLYLMHYYPVLLLDRVFFDFSVCTPRALLGAALSIGISVVLALVSRELLEKRVSGFLYRHLLSGEPRNLP